MKGVRAGVLAAAYGCFAAVLSAQVPADLAALIIEAQTNIKQGHDTEARRLITDVTARIERLPETDQLEPWAQLGDTYLLLSQWREAQHAFTTLIGLAQKRGNVAKESRGEEGLGRAALKAHDPAKAIPHLQRAIEIGGRSHDWLVSALMMQSRSPDDAYVERAFNLAERSRNVSRTRSDIAATLKTGEAYLAYLVGEENAYGWLLNREHLVGFEIPPTGLETSVDRTLEYLRGRDRDGLERISEELAPAVLGPALDALPSLTHILIVPDGVLKRLPFAALRIDGRYLGERAAISIADADGRQLAAAPPVDARSALQLTRAELTVVSIAAALLAVAVIVSRRVRRRSRARS